ncbi:MAG: hypothetical protein AAGG50_14085 [Bacteroidota bacterium]
MRRATLLLALLVGVGCTPMATSLRNAPDCIASVEGYFASPRQWARKAPALVVRDGYDHKTLYGVVVEETEEAIVFDPQREGPFHDPEPRRYERDEVLVHIGDDGQPVWGAIPDDLGSLWRIEDLVVHEQSGAERRMRFKPNAPFAFCMEPGVYAVTSVAFVDQIGNHDQSVRVPAVGFRAEPGAAVYVGTWTLDTVAPGESDVIAFPYRIVERPEKGALAALVGGPFGQAYHDYRLLKGGEAGYRTFHVEADQGFVPQNSLPLLVGVLGPTFDPSTDEPPAERYSRVGVHR